LAKFWLVLTQPNSTKFGQIFGWGQLDRINKYKNWLNATEVESSQNMVEFYWVGHVRNLAKFSPVDPGQNAVE